MQIKGTNRLAKSLGLILAAALLLTMLPPRSAQAQGNTAVGTIVNAFYLNVRSGPGVNYPVVRRLAYGDVVTAIGRNQTTTWVQLQADSPQWINAYYLATTGCLLCLPVSTAVGDTSGGTATNLAAIVTGAYYLNTRTGPGVNYPVHQRLSRGQALTLIGRNAAGTWVQIASGSVEWVNAAYLTIYGNRYSLPVSTATGQPPAPTPIPSDPYVATVINASYLNVRNGPGPGYAIVRRVVPGDQFRLIGRNLDGSWVQLQPVTASQEWVNARYVRTNGGMIAYLPITSATTPGPVTPPPATRTHVVQAGETLYRIALMYGVSLPVLAAYNGIYDYNRIYVGQVLVIP